MVYKHKGFTLIELLIAAVIIGVLAVFATQTFRQSASDIRIQDAKNRANVLAMAAHHMQEDNPGITFTEEVLSDATHERSTVIAEGNTCSLVDVTLQDMVDCGYLEYRKYLDPNFQFRFAVMMDEINVCVKINPEGSKALGSPNDEFCTDGITSLGDGAFK